MFNLLEKSMNRPSMGMRGDGGGGAGGALVCANPGTIGFRQACYVYPNNPATPGLVTPDVVYNRGVDMNIPLTMDDGNVVNMWGFSDLDAAGGGGGMGGGATFPSAPMRVQEGQIVHTNLQVGMMMAHTIHHHGIEPDWMNDGVGHISFDVTNQYTYQWRPAHAGTYFYHCHTNTVLHAEMGMYGALIVDPVPDPSDPPGTQRVFAGGPTYTHEAIWAVDEIDSSWHNLPWDAGTCGADVGLNVLNPDYVVLTGVDASGDTAINGPAVVSPVVSVGDRLLVRYICAGYHPQHLRLGGLSAEIVNSDGRPLPQPETVTEIEAVSAERYDMIIVPTEPGDHIIECDVKHWITGEVLQTARTRVRVV